ncbi:hypothetical protein [Streptomyces sp. GbtcB6]|uniref:hypothetical protein n=1 Tax=Streptomyces sp. GbtcB6 TaxID=2824751 RepID=UPI001C2F5FF7|nr:hypothetical protein [Streptomyces sp. GbtcB6]
MREFLLGSGLPSALTEDTIVRAGAPEVLAAALAWHAIPLTEMAVLGPVTVPTTFL